MRTAWLIGCALFLGACDKKDTVICLDLSGLPVGGAGGEGGTTTGGGGTTTSSEGGEECDPELRALIGCFEPDAACCDYDAPALECQSATEGVYLTPFFCVDTTKALASCVVIDNSDTTCAWGTSQLVCCNGV